MATLIDIMIPRPRLRRLKTANVDGWSCHTSRIFAVGNTPAEAFQIWLNAEMDRRAAYAAVQANWEAQFGKRIFRPRSATRVA